MAFAALAGLLTLVAVAVVVRALLAPRTAPASEESRRATLAQSRRELDAERAAGTLGGDEYAEAVLELQRQALEADAAARAQAVPRRRAGLLTALAVGVVVPAAAAAMYLGLGQPAALANAPPQAATQADPRMAALVDSLSQRLRQQPDDAEGWLLLARSYNAMHEPLEAMSAYAEVAKLRPKDADLLVEYANTAALANGRRFAGAPEKLVAAALRLDPGNLNALALAGAAALQDGRKDDALRDWRKLRDALPPGSPDAAQADALIARAEGKPVATPAIHGTVELAPALAGRVARGDYLFVYARAPGDSPMPVAVLREPASGWPVAFTLDDSHAMTPDSRLSRFAHVDIVARVSHTGSARPGPGDLEGRVRNVPVGASSVAVVIDHAVDD